MIVRAARALLALGLLAALTGLAGVSALSAQQQARERLSFVRDAYLLRGATLIDGRGGPPRDDASILIYNGTIQAVGQEERMILPEGTQVVELEGKYVLPGFVNTRAVPRDAATLQALLLSGITAVLASGPAQADALDYRDLERAGDVRGPRVFATGPALNGPPGSAPGLKVVGSEEEVRAAVRQQDEEGADFVQLYRALPATLVRAAIDEAHERGLSVIGDLETTSWIEAGRFGIDVLRPLVSRSPDLLPVGSRESYMSGLRGGEAPRVLRWLERVDPDGDEFDDALGALLGTDVSVEPSLVSIESTLFCGHPDYAAQARGQTAWIAETAAEDFAAESPAGECIEESDFLERAMQAWPTALRLTSLLHEEGVRLLAGSDIPITRLPPGVAFQRELELLVQAGIPPIDVLSIATRNGAITLGRLHEMGTVEVGKRADLVFLGSDPIDDIRATRDVEWVMLDGEVFVPGRAGDD